MVKFQERHQDYVLAPGTLKGQYPEFQSIASGQSLIGIPFTFQPDAPFILRSIAVRVQYNSSKQQPGLQYLRVRFTGPHSNYLQQGMVPVTTWLTYAGQAGNPKPIYPPVPFPAAGVIYFDLLNAGPDALTNLTIYLRGVKLYPAGQVKAYPYPDDLQTNPFAYQLGTPDIATGIISIQGLGVVDARLNQIFRVRPDADFVVRGLQAGIPGSLNVFEVFLTLKDEDEKPYSNFPVHVDVLCGQFGQAASFACGASSFLAPVPTGPSNPGLLYPEIYVRKERILWYDVFRDDTGIAGAETVDYPVALTGAKVWPK